MGRSLISQNHKIFHRQMSALLTSAHALSLSFILHTRQSTHCQQGNSTASVSLSDDNMWKNNRDNMSVQKRNLGVLFVVKVEPLL